MRLDVLECESRPHGHRSGVSSFWLPNQIVAATSDWELAGVLAGLVVKAWSK